MDLPTDAAAPEDEIVIVEPEKKASLDCGARGKAVVVSGKKKKIIGQTRLNYGRKGFDFRKR